MSGSSKSIAKTSPLSDFVRNASSSERTKIYGQAIKYSIEAQQKIIKKSKQAAKQAA